MGDRSSIGSVGGFRSGERSSVGSESGTKVAGERSSIGSNSLSSKATPKPKAADDDSTSFGVNNYQAKQKAVSDYYENTVTMENMEELGGVLRKLVREDIPAVARNTAKVVVSGLTPGFIKRFQNKKIHIKEVEEREE